MNSNFITTGVVRVLWAHLLEPFAGPYPIPRYRAVLLLPKRDTDTAKIINGAIAGAASEGLEKNWHGVNIEHISLPIKDGDIPHKKGHLPDPESAGCIVISASSYTKPDILNIRLCPIENPEEVYNGMYVCATLKFVPFLHEGKPGVRCVLGSLLKVMDGARIKKRTQGQRALAPIAKKLHGQIINNILVPPSVESQNNDIFHPHEYFNAPHDFVGNPSDEEINGVANAENPDEGFESALNEIRNRAMSLDEFKKLMQKAS